MRGVSRFVSRYGVFAPRGCDRQGIEVKGVNALNATVSMNSRPNSVVQIDQSIVRFARFRAARSLVARYARFSETCVGNEQTDDGEGGDVLLKKRAWKPRPLGAESAGLLQGWFQQGYVDWTRILAVRVGRTVSVIEVTFFDRRPPAADLVEAGRKALRRIVG